MSRFLRAAIFLLLLAACGGGGDRFSAPRDLDNACSIVRERPQYFRAMQDTERRWGVPVHVLMAVIHQESRFIGDAKTPHKYALGIIPLGRQSSAFGYSQALDGTWEEYQKDQNRRSARRDRITDATDFMGWYLDETQQRLGISKSDVRAQYLAYHEGRTGYARGSYNSKPWLLAVTEKVGQRADLYRGQLASCRR
jgi:hypothetical protein